MRKAIKFLAAAALVAPLLNGCGGGSSSSSPAATAQGVFLDNAVEGMRYVSGSLSGYTGSGGSFEYETGQPVSFYIGDILVGDATGKAVVTPVDLVPGATDQTNATVSNICQFIQSLDDDGDSSNGITITRIQDSLAEGRTIDFSQSIAAFASDGNVLSIVAEMTAATTAGARGMVSATQAQAELEATLFGRLAGSYAGTYNGDDSGTWTVVINDTGGITGSGQSNAYGSFDIAGSVASNGAADFTSGIAAGNQVGAVYAGTFDAEGGTASGTWEGGCCDTGAWTGSRQ